MAAIKAIHYCGTIPDRFEYELFFAPLSSLFSYQGTMYHLQILLFLLILLRHMNTSTPFPNEYNISNEDDEYQSIKLTYM